MQQILVSQKLYELLNPEFRLYKYGIDECLPGYSLIGPAAKFFSVHYIIKGKGILRANNMEYSLSQGQGFLLSPKNRSFYQADLKDPWGYYWIGIKGSNAESVLKLVNISESNPVFTYNRDDELIKCFMNIFSSYKYQKSMEFYLMEQLYRFFSLLADNTSQNKIICQAKNITQMEDLKEAHVKTAIEYIESNFSRKINIIDIAQAAGLELSYFGSIFKKYTGISPQDYLINYRIGVACNLMMKRNLTLSQIARMVGYNDLVVFSTIFKRRKGLSPNQYRKSSIRVPASQIIVSE